MPSDIISFVLGTALNLAVAIIIVRFIYYPLTQNKNYVFTFLAFNTIIYFVLSLITDVEISVGVGFGLFAIFSVLRYRTNPIPIREMTYLFIIIAVPVINSVITAADDFGAENIVKVVVANGTVIALLYMLEREWGFHFEANKKITYERINLILPENRQLLLDDLRARTGLPVKRIEIGRVNFLRDTAEIKIYYDAPQSESQDNWYEFPDMDDIEDEIDV